MSNLRLINETEITSSQSSTSVTDVFSSDFDIYKITLQDISTVGTTDVDINARFINSGGSVDTTGTYNYAVLQLKSYSSFTENRGTTYNRIDRITFSDQSPEAQGSVMYVYNPFSSSSYTFINWQSSLSRDDGYGEGFKGIGGLLELSSITGIQFYDYHNTRPYDSGIIRTYGLRVDS
tara:strand:+ start:225 stop:758 length:534 start_codon:yes stop_codon:yes gene_type:complete